MSFAKNVLAFALLMIIACSIVSAAPNRVLMRFGKRANNQLFNNNLHYTNDLPVVEYYEPMAQDNF